MLIQEQSIKILSIFACVIKNNVIMKKLSAYTIASNCADIDDVCAGIKEIQDEIRNRERLGKKVPAYYYIRYHKLYNKYFSLTKKFI